MSDFAFKVSRLYKWDEIIKDAGSISTIELSQTSFIENLKAATKRMLSHASEGETEPEER